jgi:UPF0716 protein FxsA
MWLFLAFLLVPLIEIALFIQVGGLIGLWPTLAIVVLTAFAGTALVRSQGSQALHDIRSRFDRMQDPTDGLAHGAMILFSGALLLTPGFFTDAIGFALLIPAVRRRIMAEVRRRITVHETVHHRGHGGGHGRAQGDVIDGDYVVAPDPGAGDRPSGWRRD